MPANTVFNYHFTSAGNVLIDTEFPEGDIMCDELVHPHEFVFVYECEDVNSPQWEGLTQMIRDRLLAYGLEIALLDNHAEHGKQRIAVVHRSAYLIVQAIAYEGVVGEFHLQHILEFGFAPVLVRHIDLLRAIKAVEYVMKTGY
jgi:hypothetical protein